MNQASFYCPHCKELRLFQSRPMNHTPHILAAVFLCGLWLPVWILTALTYQDIWRCAFCGYNDGVKYLQNSQLRQHEQISNHHQQAIAAHLAEEKRALLYGMPASHLKLEPRLWQRR